MLSKFQYRAKLLLDLTKLSWMARNPRKAYGYLRRGRRPDVIDFAYHGMRVIARKQDWIAVREVLLDDEYACLNELFGPHDRPRILDLGANIGCFALRVFARAPKASVLSVEAAHDTAGILEQNQKTNPGVSWSVVRGAVWRDDGPVYLARTKTSLGHRVDVHDSGEKVPGLSLPTIFAQAGWDAVDLIKMDIEGAEAEVIAAGHDFSRLTDKLIIEVHDDRIDGDKVTDRLNEHFKYCYQLSNRNSTKPLYLFSNVPVQLSSSWGGK